MLVNQTYEEIHVYDGVAERTGVHFERKDVRRSGGCCGSMNELIRKVRVSGDGTYYLPIDVWPAGAEQVNLHKPWLVLSSVPSSL